jgi:hypothetical protein
VFAAFHNDEVGCCIKEIKAFLKSDVLPKMADAPEWFIKNGCFSNKFDFRHSITNERKLLDDFNTIQYNSVCHETGGVSEINLREVIPWDYTKTATIYSGLPLRTEIRVFYDFDKREVMYSANYWDYGYCRPHIHDRTDQIIFDVTRIELQAGYEINWARVERAVAEAMRGVDMTGKWSIDILIDQHDDLRLIDMAQAQRSAYWRGGLFDE